jgi:TPR repeat protein
MRTLIIIQVLLFSLSLSISSYAADFNKGLTAAQSGDFATALKEWKPLAEEGNAAAQNNLGLMYHNGWGVPQDYKEAARLYRLAAEQGDADAQSNLGVMYERG